MILANKIKNYKIINKKSNIYKKKKMIYLYLMIKFKKNYNINSNK